MVEMSSRIEIFPYTENKFKFHLHKNNHVKSDFDNIIEEKWKQAEKKNLFRYKLNIQEWKILEGKYKFLAQLNNDRIMKKRPAAKIGSISQPFDANEFNFIKISDGEILFDINNGNGNDVIIINVSPFAWGHCLLIPERFKCLPQTITEYSLEKAMDIILLSESPYMRLVFNSLQAFASVNHLHWHFYYLKHEMILERISLDKYLGAVFLLNDFPSKGFCLKLSSFKNTKDLIRYAYLIVKDFQDIQMPHNVYITRAKDQFDDNYDDIRIYIWARKSSERIDNPYFKPAVCELSGQLLMNSEEAYKTIDEETASQILVNVTSCEFEIMKARLKELLQEKVFQDIILNC